jgi:hypothetical protein
MSRTNQPSGTGGAPAPGPGADTGMAGSTLTGFETRLLSELQAVVAERAAEAGQEAGRRAGGGTARPVWRSRRLALTGAMSAALAAGLAISLAVTSTSGGTPPPAVHFAAPTTVAAVLDNAAVAALSQSAVTPHPDQFVYTKERTAIYQPRRHDSPAERVTQVRETWQSVSGRHRGLTVISGPSTKTTRLVQSWCANGRVQPHVLGAVTGERCTPGEFAAYKPWLPTTSAGMRAYLAKSPQDGPPPQTMIEGGFYLLAGVDLSPAQQAAAYHALAQVPGLTLVPKMTDILGRTGVGIRSHPARGLTWTAIFDPTTFKLLGADIEPVGPGYDRVAMAVQPAIVDKVGQRP